MNVQDIFERSDLVSKNNEYETSDEIICSQPTYHDIEDIEVKNISYY